MHTKTYTPSVRPFLRWAGSKRQLLPVLASYWNEKFDRYVEPFAGSACLFFHLQPKRALLSDINADLITTYREVKHRLPPLISELRRFNKGPREYLRLREVDTSSLSPSAQAARFIYLNRFCFNGIYRTNRSGKFNVPYGGYKSGEIPSEEAFKNCARALKNAKLVAGDFEKALAQTTSGDFVYLDPPFSVKARRTFNEYDASVFGPDELVRLRQWLEKLASNGVFFLVSYAECEEAEFLCKDFFTRAVSVKRNVAGFAGSRVKTNELLISNFR